MSIVRIILVNAYKYLKIVHAQPKTTIGLCKYWNTQDFFYFNLKTNNPQKFVKLQTQHKNNNGNQDCKNNQD